jgi:hypothetical protein
METLGKSRPGIRHMPKIKAAQNMDGQLYFKKLVKVNEL